MKASEAGVVPLVKGGGWEGILGSQHKGPEAGGVGRSHTKEDCGGLLETSGFVLLFIDFNVDVS